MKWVLVAFLLLLSAAGAGVAFVEADTVERTSMQQAAASVARPFDLPNDVQLADPTIAIKALEGAADSARVNVFRTSIGYNKDDQPQMSHYVLFSTDRTKFWDSFRLRSGTVLSPSDSRESDPMLASVATKEPGQVGVVEDLGGNDRIFIRSLRTAFDSLPTAGAYYVECTTLDDCKNFASALAQNFNEALGTTRWTDADFTTTAAPFAGLQSNTASLLTVLMYGLVFFVVILLVYRQLYEAKRTGVLKMHGYSTLQIWYWISGSLIARTMVFSGIVIVAACVLVPGSTAAFASAAALSIVKVAVVALVASLLTCLYVRRLEVAAALKNRKETGLLFVTSTALKAAFTMVLVVTAAGLWTQYTQIQQQSNLLSNWQSTSKYGIYYPTSVGNDLIDLQTGRSGPTEAQVYELYPRLNAMGSVFIDSTSYEPAALANPVEPGGFRSILANPNFLNEFPVKTATGEPVSIPDSETDWVLLIPESYKDRAAEILSYFTASRTGSPNRQGVAQAEKVVFGRDVAPAVQSQTVRIVWTANQQRVFSFNPAVAPADGNAIIDPIIQVMTTANSAGVDRSNMITGSAGTGLKIKLTNASTSETQAELAPLLKELKLDDNLLHLVTMNDYALGQVEYLQQGMRNIAITAAALLVTMLALAFQCLTLTFERFSRRIVVRRLFGAPFISRYQEFLAVFALVWGIQLAGAFTLNTAGISPFSTATTSGAATGPVLLLTAATVLGLELLFSAFALAVIENKRTTDVLKGEF
ncbi:bacteriocin-associated integral membrane family protein [Paenarthrobacter nicotinovorans]|uniref:bacteriocin-associated integral membrane family protein n=1 Tax=Paenarthrobacter nicotinovorans TaxID=29320 RepID=UPI0038152C1B